MCDAPSAKRFLLSARLLFLMMMSVSPATTRDLADPFPLPLPSPVRPESCAHRAAVTPGLSRTIAQNIAYGAAGLGSGGPPEATATAGAGKTTELGGGVTMDQVVEAAEFANARDFVEEFPDG